jgi:uncharacterized protein (DUF1786 family)
MRRDRRRQLVIKGSWRYRIERACRLNCVIAHRSIALMIKEMGNEQLHNLIYRLALGSNRYDFRYADDSHGYHMVTAHR